MGLFVNTAKSFLLDMWLARQTPEKVLPLLHKVIEGAKEEFADALANGGGLYAVGYCFGGKYVLLLGSELPDTVAQGQAVNDEEKGIVKSGPRIKAGAIAHGMDWSIFYGRVGPHVHCFLRHISWQGRPRRTQGTGDDGLHG